MEKNSDKFVNIGMPAYNHGEYISDAIISLLNQTHKNFYLTISDDRSTDQTESICRKFAQKDKRIKYIRQKKHLGFVQNFNYVLKKAKGEYFMWACDDDIWEKTYIEKMHQLLLKNPDTTLAMSDYRNIYKSKKYIVYPDQEFDKKNTFDSLIHFITVQNLAYNYGLYRTKIIQKVGGHHGDSRPFFKGSDYVTIFKALCHGTVIFTKEILFYKRDTGYYTKRYEVIRNLRFNKTILKKIIRYLFFPIVYVFDYFYSVSYLPKTSFSFFEKVFIALYATYILIKKNIIFVFSIAIGLGNMFFGLLRLLLRV